MIRRHTKGDREIHFEPALNVVAGNYVTAKRRGVVDGTDYGLTGEVRQPVSDLDRPDALELLNRRLVRRSAASPGGTSTACRPLEGCTTAALHCYKTAGSAAPLLHCCCNAAAMHCYRTACKAPILPKAWDVMSCLPHGFTSAGVDHVCDTAHTTFLSPCLYPAVSGRLPLGPSNGLVSSRRAVCIKHVIAATTFQSLQCTLTA